MINVRVTFLQALFALTLASTSNLFAQVLPKLEVVSPETLAVDSQQLNRIDGLVFEAIKKNQLPGAVVCVGYQGKIVFLKAYGDKQVEPTRIPMTTDTLFDMASVTKPLATALSVMLLAEQGTIRVRHRASDYLPEFAKEGKEDITIQQLLTHTSGLIPDNPIEDYHDGPAAAWDNICNLAPVTPPGEKFAYSDVGFIVLGELVKRVSGKDVNQFSQEHIYGPLGLHETTYLPPAHLRELAATTEQRDGRWMKGEVHDPRAFLLGGVAGHAGLFSTANDLAVIGQTLANGGSYHGKRIIGSETLRAMTAPVDVGTGKRGLGWDKQSGYSSNKPDFFSEASFGHGGFTGTAFWVDPELDMFIIFLSNRVHPNGKGSVNTLAGMIGNIAVAAISRTEVKKQEIQRERSELPENKSRQQQNGRTLVGIDALRREEFRTLNSRKLGLVTNVTGKSRDNLFTADLLRASKTHELKAIFNWDWQALAKPSSEEQGDQKLLGVAVANLKAIETLSTNESFKEIDTLVVDFQDTGISDARLVRGMLQILRAGENKNVPVVILDRPNPYGGNWVSGPIINYAVDDNGATIPLPLLHGATLGELALLLRQEFNISVQVHVVPCDNLKRETTFEKTGLVWEPIGEEVTNYNSLWLEPIRRVLSFADLSWGEGTEIEDEAFGTPWIDAQQLAEYLNGQGLIGVVFVPVRFTPNAGVHAGHECRGVQIVITDRNQVSLEGVIYAMSIGLKRLHPQEWPHEKVANTFADLAVRQTFNERQAVDVIIQSGREGLILFRQRRGAVLLYE